MNCPFCDSEVDIPTVDISVGNQQCGPAACIDCGASQDGDGKWIPYDDGFGGHDARIGRSVSFLVDGIKLTGLVRETKGSVVLVSVEGLPLRFRGGEWKISV